MLCPTIFLFFSLTHVASAYLSCANGGIGPCMAQKCPNPAAQACIFTSATDVDGVCCEFAQIVVPGRSTTVVATTTTMATTSTTAACFDKLNPRTGTSDCPSRAYLCNNSIYYALMTDQCPRTCNRCPGTGGATMLPPAPPPVVTNTCQDLVDYRTGLSNCAQVAHLCRNPLYASLMRVQCRRTCGYCV